VAVVRAWIGLDRRVGEGVEREGVEEENKDT